MTKEYSVIYSPAAEKDLMDIFEYILRDNPAAAEGFISELDKNIYLLSNYPEMGPIPKDDILENKGYRMFIIDNYIAFYIIENNTIKIMRVFHGKRNYSFLL